MASIMTQDQILQKLTEIFHDVFMRDDIVLTPELTAKDVEDWDSFKQVEIIIATQEAFAVKLSTRDIDGLQRVGDLVRLVSEKLG
jgi:acyl carrier protein